MRIQSWDSLLEEEGSRKDRGRMKHQPCRVVVVVVGGGGDGGIGGCVCERIPEIWESNLVRVSVCRKGGCMVGLSLIDSAASKGAG